MAQPVPANANRPAFHLDRQTVVLLALAALAWAAVIAYAHAMGNGSGTMGMALLAFVPMWGLMMMAMMLPAVAPVATLYGRTITTSRTVRLALFVGGYLFVWLVTAIPAFAALRAVDRAVGDTDRTMRAIAVFVLAIAGLYQLTPLKDRCLRHCRSPLAQLMRYVNIKGPARDLRVAVHHAAYCIGCCWALMALFVAFGMMNVWAMVALAGIVVGEKVLRQGALVARLAGVVCIAIAAAVVLSPSVASAVVPDVGATMGGQMTRM